MPEANLALLMLNKIIRKTRPEKFLLREMTEPYKQFSDHKKVDIRVVSGGMSMSSLNKMGDPAKPINAKEDVQDFAIEPAQIYEYDVINADTAFENVNPYSMSWNGEDTVANNILYQKAVKGKTLKNRRVRREEKMLAELITTGTVNYDDGNRAFKMLFNNVAKNAYTLTNTSDIYLDMLNTAKEMGKTGNYPTAIFITGHVEAALLANTKLEKLANKQIYNLAQTSLDQWPNGRDLFYLSGLPKLKSYYSYYQKDDGSYEEYIPDGGAGKGKIIFLNVEKLIRAYGAFVNFKIDKTGKPIKAEELAWETLSEDGREMRLYYGSNPVCYLEDEEALKIWDVTIQ